MQQHSLVRDAKQFEFAHGVVLEKSEAKDNYLTVHIFADVPWDKKQIIEKKADFVIFFSHSQA